MAFEGLTSRFQLEALGDREEPAQGQVELELSGRPYDVPAQIAEGERGIGGESRRIDTVKRGAPHWEL